MKLCTVQLVLWMSTVLTKRCPIYWSSLDGATPAGASNLQFAFWIGSGLLGSRNFSPDMCCIICYVKIILPLLCICDYADLHPFSVCLVKTWTCWILWLICCTAWLVLWMSTIWTERCPISWSSLNGATLALAAFNLRCALSQVCLFREIAQAICAV